jgi:hypothetical protein
VLNFSKSAYEYESKNSRDTNLELFRIITMLLIIAHHYVVNSGLMKDIGPIWTNPFSIRSLFLLIVGAFGKTGINCFVLITGFFMCKKGITAKKFVKLLLEVMFYKITIAIIFWVTGLMPFSMAELVNTLLPIRNIGNGFTSAFLVFYLFIPFLSILVSNMEEKQHINLLLLLGFTYIFLGTIPKIFSVTMNYVSWFSVLFFIASYIRLYPKSIYNNRKLWTWLLICSITLSVLSVVACTWLGTKLNRHVAYAFVTDSNTFLAVITSISAFLFFKNLQMKPSKVINTIAGSTFGIFLIHANSDTMRAWLWDKVINTVGHYYSPILPLYVVCSVVAVFVICLLIDLFRIQLLEKPFFSLIYKNCDKFPKS